MNTIADKIPFFCSWSGGKDSCLALYRIMQKGGIPRALLTMMADDGERSRSHGLPVRLLQEQSRSLGIPLYTYATSWDNYEKIFISALNAIKGKDIHTGVFGDIDLEAHRAWVERVCHTSEITAWEPLWQNSRRELFEELLEAGFQMTIVAVKDSVLSQEYLGRIIDVNILDDFERLGIDISGENGEYHTVVTGGPIFSFQIHLLKKEKILSNGYWFLEVEVDI